MIAEEENQGKINGVKEGGRKIKCWGLQWNCELSAVRFDVSS